MGMPAAKENNQAEINPSRSRSIKDYRKGNVVGLRIEIALRQKKISITGLAALLNVKQPTVSGWIAGDRSPDIYQLYEISQITGKPIEWFFKELD
jgi:DNA-binding transcriptional regulator YiaG